MRRISQNVTFIFATLVVACGGGNDATQSHEGPGTELAEPNGGRDAPQCDAGQTWDGIACVDTESPCSADECPADPPVALPDPDPPQCDEGWEWNGDECEYSDQACAGIECPDGAVCREGICESACSTLVCGDGEACWMDGAQPFCKAVLDMAATTPGPHPMEDKTLVIDDLLLGGRMIHPPGGASIIEMLGNATGWDIPILLFGVHGFEVADGAAECRMALAYTRTGEDEYYLWDDSIPPRDLPGFSYRSNPVFEIRMQEQRLIVDVHFFEVIVENLHFTGSTDADDPTRAQVEASGRLDLKPIQAYLDRRQFGIQLCDLFKGCDAHQTIQVNLTGLPARWEEVDLDALEEYRYPWAAPE